MAAKYRQIALPGRGRSELFLQTERTVFDACGDVIDDVIGPPDPAHARLRVFRAAR